MKECPKCKAQLEDDAIFCGVCGTRLEMDETEAHVEEAVVSEKKYCIHCGGVLDENGSFCPYCGKTQDVEEEQKEEPQQESVEPPQPEQPKEQPVYYEEDENSIPWRTILVVVLIAAGAGWYFFIRDTGDTTPKDSKSSIEMKDNTPVVEEEKSEPTTPLAFLEEFYKGNLNDADYIKQHVTASVLNKLKRAYESDCPSGDCLATWVFSAYPPGSDLELEEGPIITESEDGKYSVYYKYYSLGQNGKRYNPRGLLVTITKIDDKYMISDYELVMPDIVQKPSDLTEGVDGQYRLRDGRMFLHLEKEGRNIEADFNFRDGTYVSATYTFSCSIDDENKFSSAVYKMNGTHAGKIEGSLDKKVMKVDVKVDDRYSDSYEFKLE